MPETNSKLDSNIQEKVEQLRDKYAAMGQDLASYLDGLLYTDYLTYWDYVHLDTLLSLQKPKTKFPDEVIFIIYHQITELYFKLILFEMDQISNSDEHQLDTFLKRMKRINRYLKHLTNSFDIMTDGMDQQQFLAFRMSLLPASGFQSVQYRLIEVGATDVLNLTHRQDRNHLKGGDEARKLYEHLYWKRGASELATGKKTLTLQQFERKYANQLIHKIETYADKNIWQIYKGNFEELNNEEVIKALRYFDLLANVSWPLAHLKSAAHYLQRDPEVIAATGGTNWQKYLPPRMQRVVFYPDLWTSEEQAEWGRGTGNP